MLKRCMIFGILAIFAMSALISAQEIDESLPFPIFPETTSTGNFLCDTWDYRGDPPCLKTSSMHGAFIRYPTRQKARIIVDSYLKDGIYDRSVVASLFGTLMVGSYRPENAAAIGDFWDAGYFGLVKLDFRVEAKNILWDIVLQENWAKGKFVEERYKALNVLSKERLITLRQYERLKQFLTEEVAKDSINTDWTNALVVALSSFREWNEELLPIFRLVYDKMTPGQYRPVLQAFIDFEVPDDGAYILDKVINNHIVELDDKKLCVRAAYVLDDEIVYKKFTELKKSFSDDDEINPDYKNYVVNTLARLDWYGKWEITGTENTWDDGIASERISFKLTNSLDEQDDVVDFSMALQLNDPEEMLPVGTDATYLTNNISFHVTPDTIEFHIYKPLIRQTYVKHFELKEGTGRDAGKLFMKFPLEGELERGKQKYGWVEVEKIS